MKKYYTVDDIMAYGPCEQYPRKRVEALWGGRAKLTALEIARLSISLPDVLYALGKLRALNQKQWMLFAVKCARQCLPLFEERYPEDERPRKAIEATERCIDHNTKSNRDAARSAARSAWSAAESSSWSAAESAAWSAGSSAGSAWSDGSSAKSPWYAAIQSASWSAKSAKSDEYDKSAVESARSKQRGFLIEILGGNK